MSVPEKYYKNPKNQHWSIDQAQQWTMKYPCEPHECHTMHVCKREREKQRQSHRERERAIELSTQAHTHTDNNRERTHLTIVCMLLFILFDVRSLSLCVTQSNVSNKTNISLLILHYYFISSTYETFIHYVISMASPALLVTKLVVRSGTANENQNRREKTKYDEHPKRSYCVVFCLRLMIFYEYRLVFWYFEFELRFSAKISSFENR